MSSRKRTGSGPVDAGDGAERPVVLFVDDEEHVLAGLRAGMRRLRRVYDLHFANGAEQALSILEDEPVDIIVTDMRMPGANGVDLLREVKQRHPGVIRYVLSGEAEQELVLQAIPLAHRWLTKPCDRDQLAAALERATTHRSLIDDPAMRAALAGAGALPSPPRLYVELQGLLADPEVSIARVVDLVSTDAAVSAKLLQWANSAFSWGQSVADIHAAVVRVGLQAVSELVLSVEAMRAFGTDDAVPGFEPEVLHHHMNLVSELAAGLSAPAEQAMSARVGGLLADVGLLFESAYLPDRLRDAYELADASGVPLVEIERTRYGVGHPELGAHLLSIWGLPSDVVLLVARSHDLPDPAATPPLEAAEAVRVARLLALRQPHAAGIAAPHVDPVAEPLASALDRWTAAVGDVANGRAVTPPLEAAEVGP